jgi:uncharacterized protein
MSMTDMLYRLQELDIEEERLKKRQSGLAEDPEFMLQKEHLEELNAELAEAKSKLAAAVREQHRLELELKLTADRRLEIRGRLYDGTVTNMKELEKMTRMVEEMDAARNRLEDRILELMGTSEELEDVIGEKAQELESKTVIVRELEQSQEEEMAALDMQLADVPRKREALLADMPADLVQRYQNVRGRMGARPLARVERQVCTGCRMSISATVMREIKKGDRLVQCESCGRILHWQEE